MINIIISFFFSFLILCIIIFLNIQKFYHSSTIILGCFCPSLFLEIISLLKRLRQWFIAYQGAKAFVFYSITYVTNCLAFIKFMKRKCFLAKVLHVFWEKRHSRKQQTQNLSQKLSRYTINSLISGYSKRRAHLISG